MLKKIFDILFGKRNQELVNELKKNSSFRTNQQVSKSSENSVYQKKLQKVEKFSITVPNLGDNKDVIITNWFVKTGDLTKSGTIICEIENEKAIMELESYVSGKVVFTHAFNQKIKPNTEICIIEGI
jgi:biotin carboxyl carrier protein